LSVLKYFVVCLFLVAGAGAQDLKVAAASDLTDAIEKLAPAFEKQTGIHVSVSLGSSGNFFAQIQNGAPFDVFLSADKSYPEKLEQTEQAEPGSLTSYARGALVIWTSKRSGLVLGADDKFRLADDLSRLTGPEVQKIAIANPEHAPYGRAAVAVLKHYKVYDQVADKLVLGENLAQTAQFLQSGNVDLGFLALSTAMSSSMQDKGRWLLLPDDSYPPIEQAGIVVRSSKNKDQARSFLEFLVSTEGQRILKESGFKPPKQ
jgi:molybdate transport system substrate-binding protein